MNEYVVALRKYVAEKPPNYGSDAHSILEMLFTYYHECNNTDTDAVKAAFEDLYQRIFMYINFFKTLPNEVFEAARMDGANTFRILYHIAIPSTMPITTIVFLTIFMQRWNELMWDMLIAPSTKFQTLNVLITTRFNMMAQHPGPLYAASVILTVPIVVLFLCFSKNFREGIHFMLK